MYTQRVGLKQATCLPSVECGDDIEVIWGNALRDNAQSAFERGQNVLCLNSVKEGDIVIPFVGFCWNMIKSYGNNTNRLVKYHLGNDERFQPITPYEHYGNQLYEGNVNNGTAYGSPYIDPNGIKGAQTKWKFENAGYNTVQVKAKVRRGKRHSTGAVITATSSDTQIYEFKEDDADFLAYTQHIECWYCRENPAGPTFPIQKWLIFDDSDCPLRVETNINKTVTITAPDPGETTEDFIIVAVWYEAAYFSIGFGFEPLYTENSIWVCNTYSALWEADYDGVSYLNASLHKEC